MFKLKQKGGSNCWLANMRQNVSCLWRLQPIGRRWQLTTRQTDRRRVFEVDCYRGGRKKKKVLQRLTDKFNMLPFASKISSDEPQYGAARLAAEAQMVRVCVCVWDLQTDYGWCIFFPILNWIIERILVQSSSVFISTSNFLRRAVMAAMFISAPSTVPSNPLSVQWKLVFSQLQYQSKVWTYKFNVFQCTLQLTTTHEHTWCRM